MKNKKDSKVIIFVILGIVALITITGCIDNESKENVTNTNDDTNATPASTIPGKETVSTPVGQVTSEPGISSSTSGKMTLYSLEDLVSASDVIAIVEVIDVLPSVWNTQNGDKPTVNDGLPHTIYTDANVKVVEYLKGASDSTAITIRMIGGKVGQDNQYIENQPSYSTNEKVLVFLKNDNDPRTKDVGNKHMVTAGLAQGKISIPNNNEVIVGDKKMTMDEARVIITGKGEKRYGSI